MISAFRKVLLLAIASLGFAAWSGDVVDPGYTVYCRYYYKDSAVLMNPGTDFTTPIQAGTCGWGLPGTKYTITCDPKKIAGLEYPEGYYVSSWDLDDDWGWQAYPATYNPDHKASYSGCEVLELDSGSFSAYHTVPHTFDIVPHIAMMHYTLAYDKNATDATGTAPTAADHYWSESVTAAGRVFARTGYTQKEAWNTKVDGSGVSVTCGQTMTGATFPVTNHNQAVTLYAQWSVNQYPLQINLGAGVAKVNYSVTTQGKSVSGSVTSSDTIQVDYGTTWTVSAEATEGYSKPTVTPAIGIMGTGGATVNSSATAGKVTVVFNGNGKTSGSMSKQEFTVDVAQTLNENQYVRGYTVTYKPNATGASVSPELEVAEYDFSAWNSKADGSGSSYTDQQSVVNPCGAKTGEVMLYAQWSSGPASVTLPTAAYDGHTNCGWYADSACTVWVGNPNDAFTPTCNTNLYAKWAARTYTVRFYHADGTIAAEQQVAYRESATPPTPDEKQYYKFSDWDTDEWKEVVEDLDVHPEYDPKNYWFVYHSNYNNGQAELSEEGVSCNKDQSPQSVPVFSSSYLDYDKTGYSAVEGGWNTDPNSSVAKYKPTASLEIAGNDWVRYTKLDTAGNGNEKVDIYAIWAPNQYTVKFDKGAEAATGSTPDQAFTYDQAQALTAKGFSYAGQEFLRWHDAKNNADYTDGQVVSNLTTVADDTVTLTAVWSNYHYVRFDRNGATNETEMALQKFSGAETNALSANVYGKVGYTFSGWATNTVDAAGLVVTYTNCQAAAFPDAQANETNVLYAVWATNRYTIVFDPGTNGVLGTMADISNCVYDTEIAVPCNYTNYLSYGFLGWARTAGGAVEIPASRLVASNLTAEANGTVKLYAVWDGLGELSEAVGLTNAVLRSTERTKKYLWRRAQGTSEVGDDEHDDRVACAREDELSSGGENGNWVLSMNVKGAGTLRFKWYYRPKKSNLTYQVFNGDVVATNLPSDTVHWKWEDGVELYLPGEGWHAIKWSLEGDITENAVIAIDDVTWTPGVEVKPGEEMPTYEAKEAAEEAAKSTTVTRPSAEVEAVVSAADYNAMFDVKAVPVDAASDGDWTLAIQLKESVSNEVQTALHGAEANLCSVITNDPISVSFAMKAGLYYGLAGSAILADLPLTVPETWILGSNKTQTVSAPRPSETNAFYELRMSVTKPE